MPNNTDSADLFSLEDLAALERVKQPRKRTNRAKRRFDSDEQFRRAAAQPTRQPATTDRTWSLGKIHPDWPTKSNYLTQKDMANCLVQMQNQIKASKEIPESNKAWAISEVQKIWSKRLANTQKNWQSNGFSHDDLMNFCYDANSVFWSSRVVPQDEAYRRLQAIELENEQRYQFAIQSDQQSIVPAIREAFRGPIQKFFQVNQTKSLTRPQIDLLAKVAEQVRLKNTPK